MPIELNSAPRPQPVENPNSASPTVEQSGVERAQHAADNAVRSIFELATVLEILSEAIDRYRAETLRQLREWPHAGAYGDDPS